MKKQVGVWMDHREAIVVVVGAGGVDIHYVESNVEKSHRLAGGSRAETPWGPQDIASEHRIEERRMHQMVRYFDRLVKMIGAAEQLFIMGPGEGKGEFARHLQQIHELKGRIAGVESRDKMTENQIVQAVIAFYEEFASR